MSPTWLGAKPSPVPAACCLGDPSLLSNLLGPRGSRPAASGAKEVRKKRGVTSEEARVGWDEDETRQEELMLRIMHMAL